MAAFISYGIIYPVLPDWLPFKPAEYNRLTPDLKHAIF
jgi:hypothetical protein